MTPPKPKPIRKIRKNLYIPHGLYAKAIAKGRELDLDFASVITAALLDWVMPVRSDELQPLINQSRPTIKRRRAVDRAPNYHFTDDQGKETVIPWEVAKRVGDFLMDHVNASTIQIIKGANVTLAEAIAGSDAFVTEWYADQLDRGFK